MRLTHSPSAHRPWRHSCWLCDLTPGDAEIITGEHCNLVLASLPNVCFWRYTFLSACINDPPPHCATAHTQRHTFLFSCVKLIVIGANFALIAAQFCSQGIWEQSHVFIFTAVHCADHPHHLFIIQCNFHFINVIAYLHFLAEVS